MILNIVIWIAQIGLAIKFASVSYTHGLRQNQSSMEQAIKRMGEYSRPLLYGIAIFTLLGSAGLILPAVLGVSTWIIPVTALILAIMMLAAILFHMLSRDKPNIAVSVIICALAAFVAFGRWVLVPL